MNALIGILQSSTSSEVSAAGVVESLYRIDGNYKHLLQAAGKLKVLCKKYPSCLNFAPDAGCGMLSLVEKEVHGGLIPQVPTAMVHTPSQPKPPKGCTTKDPIEDGTALHKAVIAGQQQDILRLLEKKADVLAVDQHMKTPLEYAGPEAITPLLDHAGAGTKLLWVLGAYQRGIDMSAARLEEVQDLLHQGACVNGMTVIHRKTPLHHAVVQKDALAEVVQCLLVSSANVNAIDQEGKTPLHCIVDVDPLDSNASKLVELLLLSQADVGAIDLSQNTPLHYACERARDLKTVSLLLSKCSVVDARFHTLLHTVCQSRTVQSRDQAPLAYTLIELLLEKGIDVNAIDKEERMALHFALTNQAEPEVIQLLVESRANVVAQTKIGQMAALQYAAAYHVSPEIIQLLLDKNASVNSSNSHGKTALHWAIEIPGRHACAEIVRIILENGADVNAVDNCEYANPNLGSSYGLELPKSKMSRTPLLWAVTKSADRAVVEVLLAMGADVNAQDKRGRTALQCALEQDAKHEVVNLLIQEGAEVNAALFRCALEAWIDKGLSRLVVDLIIARLGVELQQGLPLILPKAVFESIDAVERQRHGNSTSFLHLL